MTEQDYLAHIEAADSAKTLYGLLATIHADDSLDGTAKERLARAIGAKIAQWLNAEGRVKHEETTEADWRMLIPTLIGGASLRVARLAIAASQLAAEIKASLDKTIDDRYCQINALAAGPQKPRTY